MSLWTMRPFEAIASLSLLETVGYHRDRGRFCVCATCKMQTRYKGSYSVDKIMVAIPLFYRQEVTLNVLASENKRNDVVGFMSLCYDCYGIPKYLSSVCLEIIM